MRCIVTRLCRHLDYIPAIIKRIYRYNLGPMMPDLKVALKELLTFLDTVYIVLDAVDKSRSQQSLLDCLCIFRPDLEYSNVQLFATSRKYSDIEIVVDKLADISISMCNPVVEQDIRRYIENVLAKNCKFAHWPDALVVESKEAPSKGAKGM